MAKQVNTQIRGTIENLTFYEMNGQFYVRMKSSLTGKQVKKRECFRSFRESSIILRQASKMCKVYYKNFPKEFKGKSAFGQLSGYVFRLLKQKISEPEIERMVMEEYIPALMLNENIRQGKTDQGKIVYMTKKQAERMFKNNE